MRHDAVGSDRLERLTVGLGLFMAVSFGVTGGAFDVGTTQSVFYAVSSLGWVVATAVATLRHVRMGELLVAAGFLVLTIAETLLWVNGRPGDLGYSVGFAGGTMFYVPGLLLIGLPAVYPIVIRGIAIIGAIAWAAGSVEFLSGGEFSETDPLAFVAYSLLSIVLIGVAVIGFRSRLADDAGVAMSPSSATAR